MTELEQILVDFLDRWENTTCKTAVVVGEFAPKILDVARKQMIKDATEVTVHIEAGGYPYIPQMELYDYDKDIPLAKEGDKYKVVLIKED